MKAAEILKRLYSKGHISLNEMRVIIGLKPYDLPEANEKKEQL